MPLDSYMVGPYEVRLPRPGYPSCPLVNGSVWQRLGVSVRWTLDCAGIRRGGRSARRGIVKLLSKIPRE